MVEVPKPPSGLEPRPPGDTGFIERLTSSIIGTARFAAAMRKRVSARTKWLVFALFVLVLVMSAGALYFNDRNQQRNAEIEDALLRGSPEDLGLLRGLLNEGLDGKRSLRVIRYLGQRRDAASVPVLTEHIKKGGQAQYEAAVALRRIGTPAALDAQGSLVQALDTASGAERLAIALALAQLGVDEGQKIALAGLAAGELQQIEGYNADAFGRALSPPVLIAALDSDSDALVIFATRTLAQSCTDSAEPKLAKLLARPESEVVLAAAITLMRCFESSAGEVVATALSDGRIPRTEAVLAIDAEVGAPGYKILLAVEQDPGRRELLLKRLARLGDPRSVSLLAPSLSSPTFSIQTKLELLGALISLDELAALPWTEKLFSELKEGSGRDALLDLIATHATGDALVPVLIDLFKRHRTLRARIGETLTHLKPCDHQDIGKITASLRSMPDAQHAALELIGRCKVAQEQSWFTATATRALDAPLQRDARRTFGLLIYVAVQLGDAKMAQALGERVLEAPSLRRHADEILWPALTPDAIEPLLEQVTETVVADLDKPEQALPLLHALSLTLPASMVPQALRLLGDDKAKLEVRFAAAEALALSGHDLSAVEVRQIKSAKSLPIMYALMLEAAGRSLQPIASVLTSATFSSQRIEEHLRTSFAPTRAMWGQSVDAFTQQSTFLLRLMETGHSKLYDAWIGALLGISGQALGLPTQSGRVKALRQWTTSDSASLRRVAFDGLIHLKLRGEALAAAADPRAIGHQEAVQALSSTH